MTLHHSIEEVIYQIAILTITRGRFTIRRRKLAGNRSSFRLILSIAVSLQNSGIIDYLLMKIGGYKNARPSRFGNRSTVIWEIHKQDVIKAVVDDINDLRSDGLKVSDRLEHEVEIAWSFLNTGVRRGRLSPEFEDENTVAMEERTRLYELMMGKV